MQLTRSKPGMRVRGKTGEMVVRKRWVETYAPLRAQPTARVDELVGPQVVGAEREMVKGEAKGEVVKEEVEGEVVKEEVKGEVVQGEVVKVKASPPHVRK
ncbi:hypothetical protein LTR36_002809 [Oleoguttula mirabilis]|uniref:Uncharacterized protein n=1 Tax=Oleoguttula mirabilis TaxID=1507867 RepID=A0AAV9JJ75_9PEZI|nr:hypothetical protein LTR36_002809 [Oleoguttula mirabilis]